MTGGKRTAEDVMCPTLKREAYRCEAVWSPKPQGGKNQEEVRGEIILERKGKRVKNSRDEKGKIGNNEVCVQYKKQYGKIK